MHQLRLPWAAVALVCLAHTVHGYLYTGSYQNTPTAPLFKLTWVSDTVGQYTNFTMTCVNNPIGYCSFGWSTAGQMSAPTDYYVGYVSGGVPYVLDVWSTDYNQPTTDTTQNALNVRGSLVGTTLTLSFTRMFVTGDTTQDTTIELNKAYYLIWAAGKTAPTGTFPTTVAYTQHDTTPQYGLSGGLNQVLVGPEVKPLGGVYKSANNEMTFTWRVDTLASMMYATVTGVTTGWVGVGWNEASASMSTPTDYYICRVIGGVPNVLDVWSTSYAMPPADTQQDAKNVSGSLVGTALTVSFARALNTGDTLDTLIRNATTNFIWGIHTTDPGTLTTYPQHTSYSSGQINFFTELDTLTPPPLITTGASPLSGDGINGFTDAASGFNVQWQIDAKAGTIQVQMTAPVVGWVSVGWNPTSGLMSTPTDYYTGWVTAAGATLVDTWSTNYQIPTVDTAQSFEPGTVIGSSSGTNTTITFTRKLITGDPQDTDIINANMFLIWGFYGGDPSGFTPTNYPKHSMVGSTQVNFFSGAVAAPSFFANWFQPGMWAGYGLVITVIGPLLLIAIVMSIISCRRRCKKKKRMAASGQQNMGYAPANVTPGSGGGNSRMPARSGSKRELLEDELDWDDPYEQRQSQAFRPGSRVSMFSGQANQDDYLGYGQAPASNGTYYRGSSAVSYGNRETYSNNNNGGGYDRYGNSPSPQSNAEKGAARPVSVFVKEPTTKTYTVATNVCNQRVPCSAFTVKDIFLALLFVIINALFALLYVEGTLVKRTGYLVCANLFLVALPATRHSVLTLVFDLPFDKTIMYHRWLGRWTLLVTIGHIVALILAGTDLLSNKSLWGWGAFLCGIIMFISSLAIIRRKYFSAFYWIHFLFIGYYVFGYFHSVAMAPFAMGAALFYVFDRVARLFLGMYPVRSTLLATKPGDVIQIQFPKNPLTTYKVGQYAFLNFPQISMLEWHPFSISSGPNEVIAEVHIKSMGDHTQKLKEFVKTHPRIWVRCDGPYGQLTLEYRRYPALVLCAGGIGITPMISIIKAAFNYGRLNPRKPIKGHHVKHIYLVWSCPTVEHYGWFSDVLDDCQAKGGITLTPMVHITRNDGAAKVPGLYYDRPNMVSIFDRVVDETQEKRIAVFACGPAAMVHDVWDTASGKSMACHVRFDFHHEVFEF